MMEETRDAAAVHSTISMKTAFERQAYFQGDAHTTYMALQLKAGTMVGNNNKGREAVDLVLVIDQSASMNGPKLKMCKKSISFITTQLSPSDRLCLVFFGRDTEAHDFVTMDDLDKYKVGRILEATKGIGGTNLSGGLFACIEKMFKVVDNKRVLSILLLLTDSQANVGIPTSVSIVQALTPMMTMFDTTSIYTFGYGGDHDADMLKAISSCGHGTYYFINSTQRWWYQALPTAWVA